MNKNITLNVILFLVVVFFSCQQVDSTQVTDKKNTKPVELTTEQRLENIKNELKITRTDLTGKGEYDCCIHPSCDWCLLHEGSCECHENLEADKKVCPGCGLGWHNGHGVVEGLDAGQVKWNITHEHTEVGHQH